MSFDFPAAPALDQAVTFPEGPSYVCIDPTAAAPVWDRSAATATPPPIVRPSVSAVSPEVIGLQDAAPTTVTVTGADFDPSCRAFIGLNPMPTTFVSPTEVTFVVNGPQTAFGDYGVTVEQGGLAAWPPVAFHVIPNPTIKTLIPASATVAGGPVNVRLDGDHYEDAVYAATVITLDGVAVPTTYGGSDRVYFDYVPTTPKTVMVQIHNGPVLASTPPVAFPVT